MTGKQNYPVNETSGFISDVYKDASDKFTNLAADLAGKAIVRIFRGIDGLIGDSGEGFDLAPVSRKRRSAGRGYVSEEDGFVSLVEKYLRGESPVNHVVADQFTLERVYGKKSDFLFGVAARDGGLETIYTNSRLTTPLSDYSWAHELFELKTPGLGNESLGRHVHVDTRALDTLRYISQHSTDQRVRTRAKEAFLAGVAVADAGTRFGDPLSTEVSSRIPSGVKGLANELFEPQLGSILSEV